MFVLADGGISAIGGLATALAIGFAIVVGLILGLVVFITWAVRAAGGDERPRRRFWLFDRMIPLGLRLLALLQFAAAILYGFGAFIQLLFPAHSPFALQHGIAWTIVTAAAVTTGIGYLRASRRWGLTGATVAAGLVALNMLVHLVLHGRWGIDPISPLCAIVIVLILHLGYRRYFSEESGACRRCGYDLRATPGRCAECGESARAA